MVAVSGQNRLLMRFVRLLDFFYMGNTCKKLCIITLQLLFMAFQLEMEDGDEIDAMLHQTGGALLV
jgi:hypothetical protein